MSKSVALFFILAFFTASFIIISEPTLYSSEVTENTWVTKTPMPMARKNLGVAVVNGKIYAIGGFPDLNDNQEYDPATNTWKDKAAMPTPRFSFATAVHQNKIYCIGGLIADISGYYPSNITGAIEVYDPATDKWEIKESMPRPRAQLEANVINGKIYLIGGRTGGKGSTVSLNEAYDPETESWTTKASMPYPVISYASAMVDNKIYVLGGQDEFNETMNLAVNQIYDIETDTWSFGTPLPTTVFSSAGGAPSDASAQQRMYVVGGQLGNSGGATDITQVYNPENDSWSVGASMPTARFDLALAVVNNTLYAIGGTDQIILPGEEANAENEMYIPFGYGTIPPEPQPEPFPTTLVIASAVSVAVIGIGLLVYFKRRRH